MDEADYTCVITNAVNSIESSAASLTVTFDPDPASGDTDGDGLSNSLENYLSSFGLDASKDSTKEWARLVAMIPELGGFYTADQMRAMAPGQPVLQQRSDGDFQLNFNLQESTDLLNWSKLNLGTGGSVSINNGEVQIVFPASATNTRFYRLQSTP